MLLTEVIDLFYYYDSALNSPSRNNVIFGCDCGCGGDLYTVESWDAEEKQAQEAIDKMKAFCVEHNIEYDGID